jgi:cob(I)alamin adenosyltransferase
VKVYTRGGDDGTTALGDGKRVSKAADRVAAYGDVDELNSVLGVLAAEPIDLDVRASVQRVQAALFEVGARLAAPSRSPELSVEVRDPAWLEHWIDSMDGDLPPLHNFILPGGTRVAALAHHARAVCRRAERGVVSLHNRGESDGELIPFLNRLSDTLFILARWFNFRGGTPDVPWRGRG